MFDPRRYVLPAPNCTDPSFKFYNDIGLYDTLLAHDHYPFRVWLTDLYINHAEFLFFHPESDPRSSDHRWRE